MRPTIAAGSRYLITPGLLNGSNFQSLSGELLLTIRRAVDAGIELVQVRERSLPARHLFELVHMAVDAVGAGSTRILVNDRFDIAIAAGAHGVHLRSSSLPCRVVRMLVPEDFIVAVSIHTAEEARQAANDGADLAMFGPVFPTPGKGSGQGLDALAAACDAAGEMPVIAVGGIGEAQVESIIGAGARGYAAIRYLNEFVNIGK